MLAHNAEVWELSPRFATLRDETEWVETVALGWNRLVDASDPVAIAQAILAARGTRDQPATPYGDGQAAGRQLDQ